MKIAVVFFIHKDTFEEFELISTRSVFSNFTEREVYVVVPEKISDKVNSILLREGFKNFCLMQLSDNCFKSISSYNFLLTSKDFYQRFVEFDFILITQLDVLIKNDTLDYWAYKNFSYIGAPWLTQDTGLSELIVGNGGLSLRKVSDFIKYASNSTVLKYPQWYLRKKNIPKLYDPLINFIVSLRLLRKILRRRTFEDFFWSQMIGGHVYDFKIASGSEASQFAIEKVPVENIPTLEYLVGYHAFQKYLSESEWR
jgi:hypothetical protein